MATYAILMHCVEEKGGDRQELHEAIRVHSVAASQQAKLYGHDNDLLERILADPVFQMTKAEMDALLRFDKYTGRAAQQTEEFMTAYVEPVLQQNSALLDFSAEIKV